jgi:hypothetical protein
MTKKKKSKIAKKIQATKKFAGMALSRTQQKHGGSIMGGPNVVGITQVTRDLPKTGIRSAKQKQFQVQQKQKQKGQPKQTSNRNDDDFRIQMKSLQERAERNEELHQQLHRKHKAKSTFPQQRQRNTLLQMAPATFVIDDKLKSTQRLVQEATEKMEMAQFVLGSATAMPVTDFDMSKTTFTAATTFQQQFVAPPRSSAMQSNPQQDEQVIHRWTEHDTSLHRDDDKDDNPYAILHQQYDDDDDDPDDEHYMDSNDKRTEQNQRGKQPLPLLQFAPPSFRVSGEHAYHHNADQYLDPDL